MPVSNLYIIKIPLLAFFTFIRTVETLKIINNILLSFKYILLHVYFATLTQISNSWTVFTWLCIEVLEMNLYLFKVYVLSRKTQGVRRWNLKSTKWENKWHLKNGDHKSYQLDRWDNLHHRRCFKILENVSDGVEKILIVEQLICNQMKHLYCKPVHFIQ